MDAVGDENRRGSHGLDESFCKKLNQIPKWMIISRPQKSAPHFSYHQLPTSSVQAANRGHTSETMKSWGRPCIPVACKFAAIMISLDSRPTFFLAFISFAELHLVKSLAAGSALRSLL